VCVKFFRLDTLEKSCYKKRNKFRERINLIECLIIIYRKIRRTKKDTKMNACASEKIEMSLDTFKGVKPIAYHDYSQMRMIRECDRVIYKGL